MAKGKVNSVIDGEKLKKEILGKTNQDLENLLASYSDIEKVEVTYWPPFFSSRIPLWEKRVSVEIK
jgi:hypothetical protein